MHKISLGPNFLKVICVCIYRRLHKLEGPSNLEALARMYPRPPISLWYLGIMCVKKPVFFVVNLTIAYIYQ